MSIHLLITTDTQLQQFCSQAALAPFLYLDTEFVRTRTLRPQLGLIQAYDANQVVLIDPLADIDLEPFWSLLTLPSLTKVLHSCSEDLEVFKYAAKRQPAPLFDTQVAAALLNMGMSIGYAPLAEKLLDVYIDKGATRTDWVARPLSEEQLSYAAKDVLYLKPISEQLMAGLNARGIYNYVLQEGELLVAKRNQDKVPQLVYQDIKNAWRLNSQELAVLQQLAAWRQVQAEKQDLALNFVLREPTLFAIAKDQPLTMSQLKQVSGITPQECRRHGATILEIVEQSRQIPDGQQPKPLARLVDFDGYKGLFRQLKAVVEQAAKANNIPVESIASRRQLNQLLSWHWKVNDEHKANSLKPDLLQGWRNEIAGKALLELLGVNTCQ